MELKLVNSDEHDIGAQGDGSFFVAQSPAMKNLLERARVVARAKGPMLLLGESGTGKTRLCQEIHKASPRFDGPFHHKGCGEFDDGTLEAQLFGHTRDAYTSARTDQSGLLSENHGGTLVLDDIDCLNLTGQARLLRFLDDGLYYRLGEPGRPQHADVRIIATTNKSLEDLVKKGSFRQDLWFRLKRWVLRVPPLRERPEDIRILAQLLLNNVIAEHFSGERGGASFDDEALDLLSLLPWRGNIRDLHSAIEHIALFGSPQGGIYGLKACSKVLFGADDTLSGYGFEMGGPLTAPRSIQRILALTKWNKRLAARIVDVSPTTLEKLIKQHGWIAP